MYKSFYNYHGRSIHNYSRSKPPKRWHRAVKSRSPYGPRNPGAFSCFIENETNMGHLERKSFILPCGKTLAQSWAALRKAWLAFKIAHSNNDHSKMREYAAIIRKLQLQMGIEVTDFDDGLLSDQEETDPIYQDVGSEPEYKQDYDYQEKEAVYELDRDIILHTPLPDPRHEIFLHRVEKSCPYRSKSHPTNIRESVVDNNDEWVDRGPEEKSMTQAGYASEYSDLPEDSGLIPADQEPHEQVDTEEDKIYSTNSADSGFPGYESRRKKSCWYKAKASKSCYYKSDDNDG